MMKIIDREKRNYKETEYILSTGWGDPCDIRLEIIDEKKFRNLRDYFKLNYNIGKFENMYSLPVDGENLMNFFTIKKGKRGGNVLISPWKGITKNLDLSLRSTSNGTTLYETRWGRKRK